jgi:hypothetical protein
MRVRIVEDDMYNAITTNELPCNASTSASDVMDWGETEDYTVNITSSTGISETENDTSFDLLPDPSNGIVTLTQKRTTNSEIEIVNVMGELIYKTRLEGLQTTIDLSGQPKGIYFVRTVNDNKIVTNKELILQ